MGGHCPLDPAGAAQAQRGRTTCARPRRAGGIIFVLRTGIPWQMLPVEMGCGSGSTCWRRLRDWQAAGVWERLHHALLDRLGRADAIDWSRACVDSASIRAKKGGHRPARIRRIARNRARSAMLWSTGKVCRSTPC